MPSCNSFLFVKDVLFLVCMHKRKKLYMIHAYITRTLVLKTLLLTRLHQMLNSHLLIQSL